MSETDLVSKNSRTVELIHPDRPTPIIQDLEVLPYRHSMETQIAIQELVDGNYVLIEDFYSSGQKVLLAIKQFVQNNKKGDSFLQQRESRNLFYELSNRLLLFVKNHKLAAKKAPEIGWFKILYPELDEFVLPFPKVQGLNSSWQSYQKGIFIPVLGSKIFPYFGTYFPTRFEHLELFAQWLKQYDKKKQTAIDVGIGCGVLSYQLLRNGFEKVYGTDINPNAIIGLNDDFNKKSRYPAIELVHGDLFAGIDVQADLIVFNPPWLPAKQNVEALDTAIYYEETLFSRFFEDAEKHLSEDGRLVFLFSNLGEVTGQRTMHPIEQELKENSRFEKEIFRTKEVGEASKHTRRDQNWRAKEKVELWVLKRRKK